VKNLGDNYAPLIGDNYAPEKIRVIIPVGGKATRLLPLTAETSKACLRLLNRPLVEFSLLSLASQGIRFVNAHVTVAVCQPSRECLMTGRYPHRNGATGFYPVRPEVPTLMESLKAAGYQLGIMAKIPHLKPDDKFPWDYKYDAAELGQGRNPSLYRVLAPRGRADS